MIILERGIILQNISRRCVVNVLRNIISSNIFQIRRLPIRFHHNCLSWFCLQRSLMGYSGAYTKSERYGIYSDRLLCILPTPVRILRADIIGVKQIV